MRSIVRCSREGKFPLTLSHPGTSFAEAWRLTGAFWTQTLAAFARHPGLVLLYAVPAAAERAWVLLRTKPAPAWSPPVLDALLILWRVLMCAVALWIVLTPSQTATLREALASNALMQAKLDGLGMVVGRQLWLLAWEILLYIAGFAVLNLLLTFVAGLWGRGRDVDPDRKKNQQAALAAVARNLLLIPLGLIYIAVVVRDVVGQNPHLT